MTLKIGVFSAEAVQRGFGSNIWVDDQGHEIEITSTVESEDFRSTYKFDDARIVSTRLVCWARIGVRPSVETEERRKEYDAPVPGTCRFKTETLRLKSRKREGLPEEASWNLSNIATDRDGL